MTPAELFTRCGQALCGSGPRWKEQFADMLGMRTNSIDNMSKGTSRIPAGVWSDVEQLFIKQVPVINDLMGMAHGMARGIEPIPRDNFPMETLGGRSTEVNPAPQGRQTTVPQRPRRG